jgi:hypothetical protein
MPFLYSLSSGETKELTNGVCPYLLPNRNTNTMFIYVSAYNSGQFVSSTISVTVSGSASWSDEFNVNGAPIVQNGVMI